MTTERPLTSEEAQAKLEEVHQQLANLRQELAKVVIGQEAVIDDVLTCLLAGGHGLLEGVPGLGKTLLIRSISQALALSFARIQFTPDLMPADILGTSMLVEDEQSGRLGRSMRFQPGPIFSNLVLADEINRATPKTQSALLEAMAEQQVTVGGTSRKLESPFFVLATQNPLEQEGTYPLPEAQLDRFLLKIKVGFPSEDELVSIVEQTTGTGQNEISSVLNRDELLALQKFVRELPVTESLTRYVVRLLRATHPDDSRASEKIRRYVRFGGSPRGAQALLLAARVRCVLKGRISPSVNDIRLSLLPALRHRVLLNFEGEAEGIDIDELLGELAASVESD